ncbi:tRNA (adenosine(37)-N6)-dimethylallyltransferase MiaA [Candidatus Vampirococcus lugosii]|uniref:tRNA dimethylallyltransferase n=1 Tax=Candidatus Vampirococcus lugosii TaxID=2789015 RepID=A0ABS5QKK9_9BACT|nr:tRNA (adenosine(37)-N6)-dimethylallyltransferase MiaA [Candidatus Vampirococcus lugosii]MBS8121770.1 tRNA delta(2)-isopentenylpyrophosphate transferase [Candidatus Vampirococcus lugosii]
MILKNILNDVEQKIKNFIEKDPNGVIIITGPTASNKTSLSLQLAEKIGNVEIISADSRQVYKYMDIGTDKVSTKYREEIKHHLIDNVLPDKNYTVGNWKKSTNKIIDLIQKRGNIPFIVGGTGLYISSIYKNFDIPEVKADFKLREYLQSQEDKQKGFLHNKLIQIDPKEAEKIHPNSNRHLIRAIEIYEKLGIPKSEVSKEKDVNNPILMIILWPDVTVSNRLIKERTNKMFQKGLLQETQKLLDMGYTLDLQSMNGIGYKETVKYLNNEIDFENAVQLTYQSTVKFAKRQRTWFRSYINDAKQNPKKNVEYLVYNIDL